MNVQLKLRLLMSLHTRNMPKAKTVFHPPKAMHYWWSDERERLWNSLSQCDGWQPLSVCARVCVWVGAHVSHCTEINRWIWLQPIIRSKKNQHGANQTADHGCAAATCSLARALSSRHDNNLRLAAIWRSPSQLCYLSHFVHNIVSHDAIISSLFLTQRWCLE